MLKTIISWLFNRLSREEKLGFLDTGYRALYEPLRVDKVNNKLIRPVEGLVINGKQYYEFVNLADMPDSRFAFYEDFSREFNTGMSRQDANTYADEIIKANNANDQSRIGSLVFMFKDTINNCTPKEVLYNLASLVYFDKDEDLKTWDHDYNQDKIRAFKAHPDQDFFFVRLFERHLKLRGKMSRKDIRSYLNKSAVKLEAYSRIRSGVEELSE